MSDKGRETKTTKKGTIQTDDRMGTNRELDETRHTEATCLTLSFVQGAGVLSMFCRVDVMKSP